MVIPPSFFVVSKIIGETSRTFWDVLSLTYLKSPVTEEELKRIANSFEELQNLPFAIGATDGKHIAMELSKQSDLLYYSFKNFVA